jgi:non-heme chloroperoxidase
MTLHNVAGLVGQTHVLARDGTRLSIRSFGDGPALLFVASWALHGAMWDYQVSHFSDLGYRCITLDRRGHGGSDVPPSGYDMDTLADDLDAVIRTLDLSEVGIVAHSMGAAETIRYLSRHGSTRIRKVAMLAPLAPFIRLTDDNEYGVPDEFLEATVARYKTDFAAWAYELQPGFFTPSTSMPLQEKLTRQLLDTPVPVAIRCFRTFSGTDLRPDLHKIDRPVLILHGGRDCQAPLVMTGERLGAGIKGAVLKVYADAPHGIWVTHLKQVNADLEAFLAA